MTTPETDVKSSDAKDRALLIGIAPLLLYGGVLIGMYGLGSGWAAIVGYHIAICAIITLGQGWSEARALIRGWSRTLGLLMIGMCLVSGGVVFVLWPLIRHEHVTMQSGLAAVGLESWPWLAFIVYYSLVNPWLEELFWRGWYPGQLKWPVISDLLFAGYHVFVMVLFVQLFWALVTFVVISGAAFFWRFLTRRYDGLLIPVISHLAADVSIIVAAALLSRL